LKNNAEVTNIKYYAFGSSAFLLLFFTSNFKKDYNYLAPPEIFFALRLCWAGYSPAIELGFLLQKLDFCCSL